MGKSKERKIKNQKKRKGKMNQRIESNNRPFNLKQFQEINGNNFNSYAPQSFQNMMGRSYIPKHVARRERGTGLPSPFSKIGKRCPNLGKKWLDCGHLCVNFSFKVHFLRVYRSKNRRFFPAGPFFFILQMIVYRNAQIPKRLPCSKKFPVTRLIPTHLFQNIQMINS